MKNFLARLILGFLFLVPVSALAQSTGTVVVDCTTGVGLAYAPGSSRPMTLLPTGQACITGSLALAGTTSNASSAVATSATNLPTVSYNYGFNGTTWDQLQVDGSKNLKVNVVAGGAGGGAVTLASGAVASGAYAAGALAAGAFAAGAGVDGWDLTQGAKADSACGTATGTCSVIALLKFLNTGVTSAIPAGSAIIGKVGIDQTTPGTTNGVQTLSGSTTVVTGNSAVVGPTADGSAASTAPVLVAGTTDGTATGLVSIPKVSAGGLVSVDGSAVTQPVSQVPATSGGLSTSSTIVTSANGVLNVKASAGQVYKIEVSNNSATVAWLKLYNSASAPTAGSGTPVRRILIPGNSSGVVFSGSYEAGLAFGTGIGYALTGLIADNDTTAVTASVLVVNVDYK